MLDRNRTKPPTADGAGTPRSVLDLLKWSTAEHPVPSLLVGAVCVALSSVFVPLTHVSTATVTFFRSLLSHPLLIPLAVSESRRASARPARSRTMALAAGVLLAGDILLWNEGIADSGAGIATVIVNAQVILVPLLGWIFLRERPGLRFAAAIPVMMAGVALAGGLVGGAASGKNPVQGAMFASVAAFCFAGFLFLLLQASDSEHIVVPVTKTTTTTKQKTHDNNPNRHGLE